MKLRMVTTRGEDDTVACVNYFCPIVLLFHREKGEFDRQTAFSEMKLSARLSLHIIPAHGKESTQWVVTGRENPAFHSKYSGDF